MQLHHLSIKNFRVIKSADFPLPAQVIGIIGPNGAGKSSIVEAIAWSLYGNVAARSSKDEIKAAFVGESATVEVDLQFSIHGEHYRVVRRLVGRTERPEVYLYRGGASESVGSTETQKHIASLLGLEWKGFLTSFLARQQELNALSDLAAGKRREHLAGMLGIDRLDKVVQNIKADTRAQGDRAAVLAQQLDEREHVVSRIQELSAKIAQIEQRRVELLGAREQAKSRFELLNEQFRSSSQARESCSQIEGELRLEQNRLENSSAQIKGLEQELNDVLRAETIVLQLRQTVEKYHEIKLEYDREHEAAQAAKLYQELSGQLDKGKLDLGRLQDSIKKVTIEATGYETELGRFPADLERQRTSKQVELERAREAYSTARSEREVTAREIKRLTEQLTNVSQLGPEAVCDRCHRPYGDDLTEIKKHLQSELNSSQTVLAHQVVEVDRIKKVGEEFRDQLALLDNQVQQQKELKLRIQNLQNERQRLTSDFAQINQMVEQLSIRLADMTPPAADPEKLSLLKKELDELETKRQELARLNGKIERKDRLSQTLAESQKGKQELEQKIAELERGLKAIGFDQAAFDELTREREQASQLLEAKNQLVVEVTKEHELTISELKLRQERIEQFGKLEADLEQTRSAHYYGEKLGTLFTEFRKYLIAGIRPRLAEFSTTLFSEMTADKYSFIELDEEYNLRIMDNSQVYGIERFSGGEKDLANLCLRLAISLALTESANLDRSFVILDEVFGSQDDSRRELIFKGLSNLKQRFPQIFLITHIGEIKNRVETLIEVNQTAGGWSEVTLDGNLVS